MSDDSDKTRKREYYQKNKERIKAKQRQYNQDNKDKISERNKEKYQERKEVFRERSLAHYYANKEELDKRRRERHARKRLAENPDWHPDIHKRSPRHKRMVAAKCAREWREDPSNREKVIEQGKRKRQRLKADLVRNQKAKEKYKEYLERNKEVVRAKARKKAEERKGLVPDPRQGPYSAEEDAIIMDPKYRVEDVCVILQRSYQSVVYRRAKIRKLADNAA